MKRNIIVDSWDKTPFSSVCLSVGQKKRQEREKCRNDEREQERKIRKSSRTSIEEEKRSFDQSFFLVNDSSIYSQDDLFLLFEKKKLLVDWFLLKFVSIDSI